MPLRFDLAPFEKLFIGRGVLTNSEVRQRFIVEGDMPVLRAKDVIVVGPDGSSLERLYDCLQQAYLWEDFQDRSGEYLKLAAQVMTASPDLFTDLHEVDRFVTGGDFYKALRLLKRRLSDEPFVYSRPVPQMRKVATR